MNEQQTPSGNRWEPSGTPSWHPEHTPDAATGTPHATTTAQLPAAAVPPAPGRPRRLPARLRRRAAVGAAAAALLAIGGVGGFAVGQATDGDDASVVQPAGGTDPDGDGFPGGRPDFGQGTPPGFGGTPPGSTDDGSTDDGTTDDGGTTGDTA